MAKFNMFVKVHLHLVSLVVLFLIHEPSSKLASGQLEAVGAVLSVVPVTSILATAGLVGVKLAALSRLLDILGYDRAYLAQNMGTGTAASPIGLQTRYAYMFPYVPGLNISVRGDDSIGMPKDAVNGIAENRSKVGGGSGGGASNTGSASAENKRKTYPAMGLPGDYENQPKPFRGSGQLKDIFKKVGLQAHVPTPMQQQQLQQQFNLPPQGNSHLYKQPQEQPVKTTKHHSIDPNLKPQQQQQHLQSFTQPTHIDQPTDKQLNYNQQKQTDHLQNNGAGLSSSSASIQSAHVIPNLVDLHDAPTSPITTTADIKPAAGDHQLASKPSSSNSHSNNHQPTSTQLNSDNNNQSPPSGRNQPVDAATQVTMPHPQFNRPPQSNHLLEQQQQFQAPQPSPPKPTRSPFLIPISLRPQAPETSERESETVDSPELPRRPSLSSVLFVPNHAVIPQRDFFSFMAKHQRQPPPQSPLNVGHLNGPSQTMSAVNVPDLSLNVPTSEEGQTLRAVQLFPSSPPLSALPPVRPHPQQQFGAVPDSFKPHRHPEFLRFDGHDSFPQQQVGPFHPDPFQQQFHYPQHFQHLHQQPHNILHQRPTVASQGAGISPQPNEMTSTNFLPCPFDNDIHHDSFSTGGDELGRTQLLRRRRKRSPWTTLTPPPLSNPVLDMSLGLHKGQGHVPVLQPHHKQSGQSQPRPQLAQVQAQVAQQSQQVQQLQQTSHQTFGMPASNINNLRRRRRQIGGVNSLAVKLAGARRLGRTPSNSIQ